ncbi:hypothetical protein Taro_005711 [Colocasia esculenta]|uniref:Uncharacterized protein n=1 Tax=Colocasia esculenta TaxID=4460 RepID=A0A843TYN8_COLES|nr:hypothetical protein [Colocasia esculenta]
MTQVSLPYEVGDMSRWRLQEGDKMAVAFWALNRKLNLRLICTHAINERSEAPVPWPTEEQEDENPHLCPSEEKATRPLSRSRRRLSLCCVQKKRKAIPHLSLCQVVSPPLEYQEEITLVAITFVSALLVWVRRRHPARRHRGSDACYVAIRFPPQRRSLSRPYTPCVRLEHSREGLRKSPLTVDSHTVARLVVPVAT